MGGGFFDRRSGVCVELVTAGKRELIIGIMCRPPSVMDEKLRYEIAAQQLMRMCSIFVHHHSLLAIVEKFIDCGFLCCTYPGMFCSTHHDPIETFEGGWA